MDRIVIVHGMKRSGNHGIIGWILAQQRAVFLNNVAPTTPMLRGEAEPPKVLPFDRWLGSQFRQRSVVTRWRWRRRLRREDLMLSLEDQELSLRLFETPPAPIRHVLILRDPENCFASRIKRSSQVDNPSYPKTPGPLLDRAVRLWKSHAAEFLGHTEQLPGKVCIAFPAWFSNEAYRRSLSDLLGVPFSDAGMHAVPNIGHSSFDGRHFDGQSSQMNVLHRQDDLSDREREMLDDLMRDPEMADLAAEIRSSWSRITLGQKAA